MFQSWKQFVFQMQRGSDFIQTTSGTRDAQLILSDRTLMEVWEGNRSRTRKVDKFAMILRQKFR